jgi:hypothetical protein
MAKPNLALIPATIGDKVYSILPSDGVGDFDFDRGTIATRINAQGLIEEVASGENRLNYSLLDGEVVGCPHLLLEPQSTNLITYSEDFSQWATQAGGTGSAPIITSNSAISPDGTQNAHKIVFNKGTGVSTSDLSVIASSSFTTQTNTASFYIKADSPQKIVFRNSTNWQLVDVTTEWQRIDKTDTGNGVQIGLRDGYGVSNVPNTATVYLWGVQVEALSYATSYIPTNGEVGGVTRVAETCNGSGNAATFNDSEGVLMVEISDFNNDSFRQLSISSGSGDNAVSIMNTTTENQLVCFVNSGSVTQASISTILNSTHEFNKIAMLYKANDFQLWVNGIKVDTDPIGIPPSGLNTLNFDSGTGSSPFYGKTKQIQYFDSTLTDTELEQLTSWDSFRAMAEGQLYTIE